ncbi:hypothetical protein KKH27_11050 [bacterium]|nr:hypothetical protein [bacterium]
MKRVINLCVLAVSILASIGYAEQTSPQPHTRGLDQGGETCATATEVYAFPFCDVGTTAGYANDYTPSCNTSTAPDVVYHWRPSFSSEVSFSLCGSDYDCILHVWRGCPSSGGVEIACNDDACGLQSCLTTAVQSGLDYYIIVDGYQSNSGAYRLNIVPPSMGCPSSLCGWIIDDCEEALPVSVPSTTPAGNVGSTDDFLVGGGCPQPDGPGVWFSFIAPSPNELVVELTNVTFQVQMWLFCGCCNDYYCHGYTPCGTTMQTIGFCPEPGMQYLVLVAGCDGEVGTFDFVVSSFAPCAYGTCFASLEPDLYAPGVATGNTCNQCNNCSARPSEDEIVPVIIPYTGQWVFSLCNSAFDTYMLLGTQPCTGDIYERDDTCGVQTTTTCLTLNPGQYFVTIEAYNSLQCGNYELHVNPCPLPSPRNLVIQADPPNISLSWLPPVGGSVTYYVVYRSTNPSLIVAPGNVVATPFGTAWQDVGIIQNPSDRFFYAVTAVAP